MDYCIPQQMYSSTNSTINSCSQSQFLVNSTIKGTKWIYDTKNFHKTVVTEVTKTCKYFLVLILFFSGILYVIKIGTCIYLYENYFLRFCNQNALGQKVNEFERFFY